MKNTLNTIVTKDLSVIAGFVKAHRRTAILLLESAVIGAVFFGLAMLASGTNFKITGHGIDYSHLAEDPFNVKVPHKMRFRILTPSLAYFLNIPKEDFHKLPWFFGFLFLAAVYAYFRQKKYSIKEGMGMVALMAFSVPLHLALHWPGYLDIVSYFFLFMSIAFIKRPAIWPIFYAFALLNHEANIFAAPWLFMMALWYGRGIDYYIKIFFKLALAFLPMLYWRYHVINSGGMVAYGWKTYLTVENIEVTIRQIRRTFWLGLFFSFRLFWFIPFVSIYQYFKNNKLDKRAWWLILVISCSTLPMLVAVDITRMAGIAFPAILIGAHWLREKWGSQVFTKYLWGVVALNFLTPMGNIWAWQIDLFTPLLVTWITDDFIKAIIKAADMIL